MQGEYLKVDTDGIPFHKVIPHLPRNISETGYQPTLCDWNAAVRLAKDARDANVFRRLVKKIWG